MKIIKAAIGFILLSSVAFSAVAAGKSCSDIVVEAGILQTKNMIWGLQERPDLASAMLVAYIKVCESAKNATRVGVGKEVVMAFAKGNANREGTSEDMKPVIMKISELAIANAK